LYIIHYTRCFCCCCPSPLLLTPLHLAC
jgi:hypothetical protein